MAFIIRVRIARKAEMQEAKPHSSYEWFQPKTGWNQGGVKIEPYLQAFRMFRAGLICTSGGIYVQVALPQTFTRLSTVAPVVKTSVGSQPIIRPEAKQNKK